MRILGVNWIDRSKNLYIALTKIYGIGITRSKKICADLELDPMLRLKTKSMDQQEEIINKISKYLETWIIGPELKQIVRSNIERLKKIKCYRGIRHLKKLPVHGQRTHSNAKTCKRVTI